jgi:hypothetical protein
MTPLVKEKDLCYIYSMSVTQTVEIPASHRLTIEVPREVPAGKAILTFTPTVTEPNRWLRGCCKNQPGGSVDDFLTNCRSDKERELAIEKRQEERPRHG